MVKYSFPNIFLGLGSDNEYVRDLQRELGVIETGIFDFLTMAHVVVHKFKNGLNHEEPIVDQTTWDSIMGVDSNELNTNTPDIEKNTAVNPEDVAPTDEVTARRMATGGNAVADENNFDPNTGGISTPAGSLADRSADVPSQSTVATPQGEDNAPTTVTGVTTATPENTPPEASPETNPDSPRTDQPTVTAEDQERTGSPAPTDPNPVDTDGTDKPREDQPTVTAEEQQETAPETVRPESSPSEPNNGEAGNDTTTPTPAP
jgi:hypothetical protein